MALSAPPHVLHPPILDVYASPTLRQSCSRRCASTISFIFLQLPCLPSSLADCILPWSACV